METESNKASKWGPAKGSKRLPLNIRKQAIAEYESGDFTLRDIADKYGVSTSTITNWKYQIELRECGVDPIEAAVDVVLVANEILSGIMTKEEAIRHYGFTKPIRVQYWVNRVRKENWLARKRGDLPKVRISGMQKIKKEDSDNEQINVLQDALESARLRILALETLIDVAERDLGVNIRKKPGTKQSKK